MKQKTVILSGWILFLGSCCYMTPVKAQTDNGATVFKIGVFDRSSAEFSGETPKQPVNFVIGKSSDKKDWYATQPAELASQTVTNKTSNNNAAPRTITFSLEQAPLTGYRLHVALLIESASVPTLKVGINGKHGTFYLHPELDYNNGDQWDSFYPAYSHADVVFDFPGSYLKQGSNTITLQAVEEADKAVPEASLTYDAIELDQQGKGLHSPTSSAQMLPSIFYQQRQGELDEIVNIFVRYVEQPKSGNSVDAVISGRHYHQALQGGQDFGEEKLKIYVPEFSGPTEARLSWIAGGKSRHQSFTIVPQKKWTLFLVPHIHLDVGYSDYQAKVAAIQSRVFDEAMDMTAQHPDFRFSTDGEWNLEQF